MPYYTAFYGHYESMVYAFFQACILSTSGFALLKVMLGGGGGGGIKNKKKKFL